MAKATLRFYAELNDFLPSGWRQRERPMTFEPPAPVRHLIECCGVPHTEVELILRDGASLDLEDSVAPGDRIAVYPMFEAFDIRPLLRLRRRPLRELRFLADAHLGGLARQLRMLGFDTDWHNDLGDTALAELAAQEHRILLTRDRRLLMRQAVTHGCYLRTGSVEAQLAYLVQRLQLCDDIAPFTRCMICNAPLAPVAPAEVRREVPPLVFGQLVEYWRCTGCRRVYWRGSHWEAMVKRIARLCPSWADGLRPDAAP